MTAPSHSSNSQSKPWYRILYVQVLLASFAGILIGYGFPNLGIALKPLADAFIKLIKMVISPVVFCTVVHGIASMGGLKKLGRIGGKALLYFEIVSTLALVIGLIVVNVWQPGAGFNIDLHSVDASVGKNFAQKAAQPHSTVDFLLNIIPNSFFDAFVTGDLLQVLLIAVLTALGISSLGTSGTVVLHAIEHAGKVFFAVIHIVVKAAPVAALGAMGFTIGKYGIGALSHLGSLLLSVYFTAGIFIILVLGGISRAAGFSIFKFIKYIRDEIFLVFGTSSSETALPGMLEKLRRLGCAESTVGLVIPTGYSFNLDGTNIYMTMAAVFLAQATNTPLDLKHQIVLLVTAMISSKGAAAVTGGGFITLAVTLAAVPSIPIESLAILVGIDRFMSECRALTNLIGNGVATVVISRWEKEITAESLNENLQKVHTPGTIESNLTGISATPEQISAP
jgi:aerobic C4-dicarboxylate transport protein